MANTSSFYGNLEGNATSADKINHTLTIGDKVFDGTANVEISRISIANGGTGATTAADARAAIGAGTYSKPAAGIPKTDLSDSVQASLGKADTALQEHQSLATYRTAAEQNIIDNGKQNKITSTNKLAYSLISGTPTIPTVPTNVSAFTNDEGYLTLATLPKYEGAVE